MDNLENASYETLFEQNAEWERQFGIVMEHQHAGIVAESSGDTDSAILSYTSAVLWGQMLPLIKPNNYFHSVERLCVLYRRVRDYAAEVKTIELALLMLADINFPEPKRRQLLYRYEQRLNRAKALANR